MKFIFWQNTLSIHQVAFLKTLSLKNDITLVVEQSFSIERKSQGWDLPVYDSVRVLVSPSGSNYNELFIDRNTIHVFSGIIAYPFVYKAFKIALKERLIVGVILEPYDPRAFLGFFRRIRYRILGLIFNKKINFLLVTGQNALYQYQSAGFCPKRIFQWGYFVENEILIQNESIQLLNSKPKLLYVGLLNSRKNVISLLNTCKSYHSDIDHIMIVGDGPLKKQVNDLTIHSSKIKLQKSMPNKNIKEIMKVYDILILPSLFDGWGAVVNEALHAGMHVIASENCGSSILLDGNIRGEVFSFNKINNLQVVLKEWIKKGIVSPAERQSISLWANDNISGNVATDYFMEVIRCVLTRSEIKPIAPWLRK